MPPDSATVNAIAAMSALDISRQFWPAYVIFKFAKKVLSGGSGIRVGEVVGGILSPREEGFSVGCGIGARVGMEDKGSREGLADGDGVGNAVVGENVGRAVGRPTGCADGSADGSVVG
jgi:hypothetical protein